MRHTTDSTCPVIANISTAVTLPHSYPSDSFGVTAGHICEKDMLLPLSDRGYAAYPVNRWTRKCGIDYDSISMLFDKIYDSK